MKTHNNTKPMGHRKGSPEREFIATESYVKKKIEQKKFR